LWPRLCVFELDGSSIVEVWMCQVPAHESPVHHWIHSGRTEHVALRVMATAFRKCCGMLKRDKQDVECDQSSVSLCTVSAAWRLCKAVRESSFRNFSTYARCLSTDGYESRMHPRQSDSSPLKDPIGRFSKAMFLKDDADKNPS